MKRGVAQPVMIGWLALISAHSASAQSGPAVAAEREGRVTISRGSAGGAPGSSVEAIFMDAPVSGAVISSDGPCTLRRHIASPGLSAGTISITGTAQPITLEPSAAVGGVKYVQSQDPSFADGATLTMEATGGADIAAFSASVTAPNALTGYETPRTLARSGVTASWAPESGTAIMIVVGATNPRIGQSVLVVCRLADTGSYTIPASTFALIPPSFDQAIVSVARVAESVRMVGNARITVEAVSGIGAGPFTLPPPPPVSVATAPSAAQCVHCLTSPRLFFGVAVGAGGASRIADVAPIRGSANRLQLGQRLGRGVHLIEEVTHLGSDGRSPTGISEDHSAFGVGLRWTPFAPRPRSMQASWIWPAPFVDIHAFYFTMIVGADVRDRVTSSTQIDESAWSPMASLAMGLLEIQGQDWSLGPEFREQLARYDGHFQPSFMWLLAVHLNAW